MTNRLSQAGLRALAAGGAAAALAVGVGVATTAATAATPAPASCPGISFTVLHNDQSGGVTLPGGKYTVYEPEPWLQARVELLHDVLEQVQRRDSRVEGQGDRQGLGHLHQERHHDAVHRQVEQRKEQFGTKLPYQEPESVARPGERDRRYDVLPAAVPQRGYDQLHAPRVSGRLRGDEQRQADREPGIAQQCQVPDASHSPPASRRARRWESSTPATSTRPLARRSWPPG